MNFDMQMLIDLAIAAAIVAIGFVLGPLFKKWIIKLSKSAPDRGALTFLGSCTSVCVKIFSIVIALSHLGLNMNVIVGAFSALGLGVSLALKDNMANVAGGIQILFTRPFSVGDYIKIEDKEGTVVRIEVMFVVLRTANNQEIIVPNSVAISDIVVNYSLQQNRRVYISFDIAFEEDVDRVIAMCDEILSKDVRVLRDPMYQVVVEQLKPTGIQMAIYCWCDLSEYWNVLYDVNKAIQKKRLELNIKPGYTLIKSNASS